jgi:hypothetical protein
MGAIEGIARNLAFAVSLLFAGEACAQSAVFNFTGAFTATVDCDRPLYLHNLPITATVKGQINSDKSGTADLNLVAVLPSAVHFDGQLGRTTAAPGGTTARMQITAHNRLRLVWDLPNNLLVVDVAIGRGSCTASLNAQLKRGQREYSLYNGHAFFYCGKPRVTSTSCSIS